jgi:predicted ATPase/DNA-binding SARP family transcriptional activator
VSRLMLHLLGPPRLELDGEPVHIGRHKALALLAYLAVTGCSHSRDSLAALLWPEYDQSGARADLRRTLSVLNRTLGSEWLTAGRETAGLNPDAGLWLDVDQFRSLLAAWQGHGHPEADACPECLDALAEAVELYQGDFLAGFTLRDSALFDEWQFFQTEGLRRGLASALKRLVWGHAAQGDCESAIPYARRWLALDPLHEPAHRCLMELYAQAGHRAAALRQYEECVRILEEELGLPPCDETTGLYERIRAGPAERVGTSAPPRHNLPAQSTPFVGREDELAEIAARLGDPDCRLLTLVGPGGSGKTRLALEAAARQIQAPLRRLPGTPQMEPLAAGKGAADTEPTPGPSQGSPFIDGVLFVSLAPLRSVESIVPTVARAVGFSFYDAEVEARQQLLDYLRRKRMLLVLDHLEHLLEGVALVTQVLESAPGVEILATSRAKLNLQAEHVFAVTGMHYPGREAVEDAARYSAVKLFLDRARRARSDFELVADNVTDVVDICRLVEGMPLGIVLAAAWVGMLTPAEIADEIGRSLDFLETDLRDLPERQRSVRAAFDHSWKLLTEREREVFQALSVFRGGFTREAAQAVTGASLRELIALADKSLLYRASRGRYDVHELLRQYAEEKLDQVPQEKAETRDRHCSTYTRFLQQREEELKGVGQGEALDEIAAEIDNVRAAWRWAIAQARVPEIRQAAESLFRYYLIRTQVQEGEEAFAQAVAALESPACQAAGWGTEREVALGLALVFQGYLGYFIYSPERARALVRRGLEVLRPLGARKELALAKWTAAYFDAMESPAEKARLARESLAIYEELGDRSGIARCYLDLGLGPPEGGYQREYLEKSLALSREIGDRWCMAFALFILGENSLQLGAYQEAKRYYQESLVIRRQIGDHQGMQWALDCLGFVAREQGEYGEAQRLILESLTIAREIGDQLGVSGSLDLLGLVALDLGDYEEAEQLLKEGLAIRTQVGAGWEAVLSIQHLGDLALAVGDHEGASRNYHRSLRICQDLDRPAGVAEAHRGLGAVCSTLGDPEGARQHFRAALEMAADVGARLDILARFAALMASEGEREGAAELSAFVLHHRASPKRTQNRAGRLLDELASQLPPGATAAAQERGRARDLDATVAELSAELGA